MKHTMLWIVGWSLAAMLGAACAEDDPTSRDLTVEDVPMQVQFPDSQFTAGSAPLLEWIRRSADIVTHYYGHFPVQELRIRIQPVSGDGVQGGTTFGRAALGRAALGQARGRAGGLIRVRVGRDVTASQLVNDWVLVHEMIHLALP